MPRWRAFLRSVPGQLSLFGITFLGAVVLAVVGLFFRDSFFERHSHEHYKPLSSATEKVAKELLRNDLTAEQEKKALEQLGEMPSEREQQLDELYGTWIEDRLQEPGQRLDPNNRLARRLMRLCGSEMLQRVGRTLVVGNAAQRSRALQMLELADSEALRPGSIELARYARTRAERRGDVDLAHQAADLLRRFED